MTASRLALPNALGVWLAPWRARWRALAARERRLVRLAVVVLAVFVLWTLAVAPAWRTVRDAPAELDRLDRQLHEMQRLAAESRELRATPPLPPSQAAAALRAATARLGDGARLTLAGDRATVTLAGVDAARLRDWIAEVRIGARAHPVEVQLTRAGGGFSGSIVLALTGGGGE